MTLAMNTCGIMEGGGGVIMGNVSLFLSRRHIRGIEVLYS